MTDLEMPSWLGKRKSEETAGAGGEGGPKSEKGRRLVGEAESRAGGKGNKKDVVEQLFSSEYFIQGSPSPSQQPVSDELLQGIIQE